MAELYEKLLVAATPEVLEQGQQLDTLPARLQFMGWFDLEKRRQPDFERRFSVWFQHDNEAQRTVELGKPLKDEYARAAKNVTSGPWQAIHALANTYGILDPSEYRFGNLQPKYIPRQREVLPKGVVQLSTIALFSSREYDGRSFVQVEQAVPLGVDRDQAAS